MEITYNDKKYKFEKVRDDTWVCEIGDTKIKLVEFPPSAKYCYSSNSNWRVDICFVNCNSISISGCGFEKTKEEAFNKAVSSLNRNVLDFIHIMEQMLLCDLITPNGKLHEFVSEIKNNVYDF